MNALSRHFASERFKRCPVCGAREDIAVGSADAPRHARSYSCDAVIECLEGISVVFLRPCPTPSAIAADSIITEAREGETA